MQTVKLTSTKGFLLLDLDDAPVSVGLARSAPTILQGGAANMARSVTYTFACFGIRAGGAQLGVNSPPDGRAEAVAAALAELAPRLEQGTLLLDPGRGVSEEDLAAVRSSDPRPAWLRDDWHGASTADFLIALGACAAAEAAGLSVEGRRVAIEGFGPVGLALARLVADRGGTIVAVATGAGTQVDEHGFDVAALGEAWAEAGEGMVKSGAAKPTPAWSIFGLDADLLFIGSKAGALGHDGAEGVRAKGVVPIGPVPFTTKALLTLQRALVTVVPDFVALAGPHLAAQGGVADPAAAAKATTEGISEVVQAASSHEQGLFLGACQRAEDFLRTWQHPLPFGRPLA